MWCQWKKSLPFRGKARPPRCMWSTFCIGDLRARASTPCELAVPHLSQGRSHDHPGLRGNRRPVPDPQPVLKNGKRIFPRGGNAGGGGRSVPRRGGSPVAGSTARRWVPVEESRRCVGISYCCPGRRVTPNPAKPQTCRPQAASSARPWEIWLR